MVMVTKPSQTTHCQNVSLFHSESNGMCLTAELRPVQLKQLTALPRTHSFERRGRRKKEGMEREEGRKRKGHGA